MTRHRSLRHCLAISVSLSLNSLHVSLKPFSIWEKHFFSPHSNIKMKNQFGTFSWYTQRPLQNCQIPFTYIFLFCCTISHIFKNEISLIYNFTVHSRLTGNESYRSFDTTVICSYLLRTCSNTQQQKNQWLSHMYTCDMWHNSCNFKLTYTTSVVSK